MGVRSRDLLARLDPEIGEKRRATADVLEDEDSVAHDADPSQLGRGDFPLPATALHLPGGNWGQVTRYSTP